MIARTFVIVLAAVATVFAAENERIVSASGSITETIYALGGQEKLAAVDISSNYPAEAARLPKIGYARQLSAEGILSMNPTLVLAHEDAGPPEVLGQVEKSGVKVVKLTNKHTAEAAVERINRIGELLGLQAEAETLAASLTQDLKTAGELAAKSGIRPKVLFIYTRGPGVVNVSGRGTAADAIITLAGGANAITAYEGYRPLTAEGAVEAAPDIILVTSHGLDSAGGVEGLLKQPGLALTPAGKAGRVYAMDDLLLLGFGPRLGKAVLELNEKLHKPASLAARL